MAAALCAASWCFALHAPARLEDVARGAGRIVRGRVVDISAKWVHDGRGRHIYTYATVEVDEYLKGGGKPRLSVELRGGTAGGITEYVSGAASVAKGKRWSCSSAAAPAKCSAARWASARCAEKQRTVPWDRCAAANCSSA
jgi:hypothetical protein